MTSAHSFRPRAAVWLAAAIALGGCAVGPDYERPEAVTALVEAPPAYAEDSVALAEAGLPGAMNDWWTRLGDTEAEAMVDEMAAANPDLAAAAARLEQAEAQVAIDRGGRLPAIDVSSGAQRSFAETQTGVGAGSTSDRTYTNQFDAGLSVSWQADLFGKLQHAQAASEAQLLATAADRDALFHSLVAELVRGRVALAILERRVELAQSIIESRQATLETVERRYRNGLEDTTGVDVALARENLAQAQAGLPDLNAAFARQAHAIDILLGRRPGVTEADPPALPDVPPQRDFATGLPAALLDRRPDLRGAELRLVAANENIGAAIADLYPDLTLSANLSSSGPTVADLFDPVNLAGSIAGDLMARLFSGGALEAQVDLSEAQARELSADYAGAILGAIGEVEDALSDEREIAERMRLLENNVAQAQIAVDLADRRYRSGLGSLLELLDAQRSLSSSEEALLLAQQDAWDIRIDLILALGGDWQAGGDGESWQYAMWQDG